MLDSDDEFGVVDIKADAPGNMEQMGTKPKFWFEHAEFGRCLFKEARPNTGEDWSEKIACELCSLLELPHAHYELAKHNGKHGTVSVSFLGENDAMVHGNEALVKIVKQYEKTKHYGVSKHTVSNVLRAISDFNSGNVKLPMDLAICDSIEYPCDVFVGYLMLDAWIANQDRHHENWAFITTVDNHQTTARLAPTYDHASSMGRNETDAKRKERLSTKDKSFSIATYAERAKSALYKNHDDRKPLSTIDAFRLAAEFHPSAAAAWLDQLAAIPAHNTLSLLKRIPSSRISPIGIEFTQKLLETNQKRLLKLTEEEL